jgi:DnaK suppressor protein
MADSALNKDHANTNRMPNHMAELGSDNFDQELTLSLLDSEANALDQVEAAIERKEVMASARPAA